MYIQAQFLDKSKIMLGLSLDHIQRTFGEDDTFYEVFEINIGIIFLNLSIGFIMKKRTGN